MKHVRSGLLSLYCSFTIYSVLMLLTLLGGAAGWTIPAAAVGIWLTCYVLAGALQIGATVFFCRIPGVRSLAGASCAFSILPALVGWGGRVDLLAKILLILLLRELARSMACPELAATVQRTLPVCLVGTALCLGSAAWLSGGATQGGLLLSLAGGLLLVVLALMRAARASLELMKVSVV